MADESEPIDEQEIRGAAAEAEPGGPRLPRFRREEAECAIVKGLHRLGSD